MPSGNPAAPRVGTVGRQGVADQDVVDPGAGRGGDVENGELGPIVLEPSAVLAAPHCHEVLVSGQLGCAGGQHPAEDDVTAGACFGEQEERWHLGAGNGVCVGPVEGIAQDAVSPSRRVVEVESRLLVVAVIGNCAGGDVDGVGPVGVVAAGG